MIRNAVALIGRRSVSLTAVAGLLVQAGRPLVSLVTLPLLLAHLGQEGLGVWMIALSLMGLLAPINGGLSVSLVTLTGRANAESSRTTLHRLATAATLIAALTAGVVLSVILPAALALDWTALLNLNVNPSGDQVRWMMVVLASLLGVGMVTSVPRQIMLGRMHGYLAFLLDFAGVVAGAVALIVGLVLDAPLWLLALAFMGPSSLTMIAGGMVYLRHAGIPLVSRRHLHRETLTALGRDSLRMAGYHVAYSISSQSDLFLIGMILGSPASATYGVAQRVFSLPIMLAATVNYAQWPAMAQADAAGDHAVVARMFRYTLLIASGGATAMAVVAALAYQSLLGLWFGHQLETDPPILVGMVAWVLVATLVSTCDSILRARNETTLLMRSMLMMAVINVATTLFLLPRIGPAGAIWGSVTGYALALLIPYSLRLRRGFAGGVLDKTEVPDAH